MQPTYCLFLTLFSALASHAVASDTLVGHVSAEVVRVRDGDSIDVRAHIWPGQVAEVSVRLRGIDAPELRARCKQELELAFAAKQRLKDLVKDGSIQLRLISGGKYFGRVLARVHTRQGEDVQTILLREKLARSYSGGKRQSWCDDNLLVTGSTQR